MRKAARSQHSVHYISVSSAPGHRLRLVADVGAKEGIERAILTDHGQTGPAAVIVSGGSAYLRGNAFTLRVYFGFTKAQATKYAGKWISVPSSNPGYATVSAGVTFPSYLSQLFQPLTKLSLVTAGGLIGVHGMAPGQTGATVSAAIFAPAHGEPLPVKQTAKSSGNLGAGVVTMSNWGEAVHVPAPRDVVPVKTVVGG
jgi:hypothetical protein